MNSNAETLERSSTRTVNNLYLFTGEEFLRKKATKQQIEEIKADSHRRLREVHLDGEEVSSSGLSEEIRSLPLFEEGKIILIKSAHKLPEQAGLSDLIERGIPERFYLILEAERLNKRSRLYKAVERYGVIKEFPKLDRRSLPRLVKEMLREKGIKLTPDGFRYLLEATEGDLNRIETELMKLSLYPHKEKVQPQLGVKELEELLFSIKGENIFRFLDALSERKRKSVRTLRGLLRGGEDPNKIFFMVAGQIRSLLVIKSFSGEGYSDKEIGAKTGQYNWLVRKRREQAAHFSEAELINYIHTLHQEDALIKRGEREAEEALFTIALSMVKGASSTA